MNVALVGYGKMGKAIETVASARGHRVVAVVDPQARGARVRRVIDPSSMKGVDAAFEFTGPATAASNVAALLAAGIATVCGSTGWETGSPAVTKGARKAGIIVAPNFSVGMNLFYSVVQEAARKLAGSGLFDAYVFESHHRGKVDAPSGTARRLAALVAGCDPRGGGVVEGIPAERIPEGAVSVAAVRAGHEPGLHTVGFDGEYDAVTLTHRARGRAGFAFGAVLAAEWLQGKKGPHGFDEVLADLLRRGKGGRP